MSSRCCVADRCTPPALRRRGHTASGVTAAPPVSCFQPDGVGAGASGIDLARVALHAARAAERRGATRDRAPARRRSPVRPDGRDPQGFATVLQGLMADRAWDMPAAGGSVLDQWPTIAAAIAPGLDAHVTATACHPTSERLDLRPDSSTYATQLRLISARVIAAANESAGTGAVRSVRVLAVGAAPDPRPAAQTPTTAPDAPPAPVKTRERAPGFHQALAAHQAVAPPSRIDPSIATAVEQPTAAMRALSLRAFPEPEPVADDQPAPTEQARIERRRQADVSHTAALRRARAGCHALDCRMRRVVRSATNTGTSRWSRLQAGRQYRRGPQCAQELAAEQAGRVRQEFCPGFPHVLGEIGAVRTRGPRQNDIRQPDTERGATLQALNRPRRVEPPVTLQGIEAGLPQHPDGSLLRHLAAAGVGDHRLELLELLRILAGTGGLPLRPEPCVEPYCPVRRRHLASNEECLQTVGGRGHRAT
ncbi:DciA family protein [Streptomyces sp. NPDC052020]|uniref:DciA family protein n=1 Tax=Streptomyces sp. NPDC052020 TaxID=3155677 RepID=UPI0034146B26